MHIFDAAATADLLDHRRLKPVLEAAISEYAQGKIGCPPRLVVSCEQGGGLLLSMPCHSHDILAHKLLTLYSSNATRDLPVIQGHVTAFDATTGRPLFSLDGPTTTARRTAAVSMIAIEHLFRGEPTSLCVIGTGAQAVAHVEAVLGRYPHARVSIRGSSSASTARFCGRFDGRVAPHRPGDVEVDVVVAVTSSRTPVYDQEAVPGRLVVGVGAYRLDMVEIGPRTVAGSQVYVDDPVGAPGEAGDIAAAGSDWSEVKPLADALVTPPDFSRPVFFKSVGCGAWDLAACRAARQALGM